MFHHVFGCSAAYRLLYDTQWSIRTAISPWIDNVSSLCVSQSHSPFPLFHYDFFFDGVAVVIIISASVHKITQKMPAPLYSLPMFIDHINVWCADARLDECLITVFVTPLEKKVHPSRRRCAETHTNYKGRSFESTSNAIQKLLMAWHAGTLSKLHFESVLSGGKKCQSLFLWKKSFPF